MIAEERLVRSEGQMGEGIEKIGEGMTTYADRVKKGIPVAHALVVAKAVTQQRKIRLIKAMGTVGEGLSNLSKKKLVEKANLVLAMMVEGTGNKPVEVRFIGVNKERGQGGVTYELNSMEAMDWIK